MRKSNKERWRALQVAVSATALSLAAGFADRAAAQEAYPTGSEHSPTVVPHDGLDPFAPPPTGVLDSGVIGVGQMITDVPPPGGSVGLCTGTLINPRTVIFAAHCVNDAPASAYGSASGGIAMSFGFNADNLPAAINWISNGWATNTDLNIYNVNQVWWDPRSLEDPFGLGFLEADIAMATLDTPAFGIPTWTLLFSPITEQTHATVVGYGATGQGSDGANLGIDFRRRSAENMLSALVSLDDVDNFLFGANSGLVQNLYQLDFDDPLNPPYDGETSFDFDLFDGDALANESTTAGGDSGGPLIVDQMFDTPVVVGVLSGGSRFHGAAQPFSSYGTSSFYQPLFLFWDVIVQNNAYVYAASRPGVSNWNNPNHWVQAMDPNYAVIRNGELVNDLPDTAALGVTGESTQFGQICFDDGAGFEVCQDASQSGPGENSTGPGLVLPGGPGSTHFVPNNVDPDPLNGVAARYYDVTLAAPGITLLTNSVTIDRFTIDGLLTELVVRNNGELNVLGDFNMFRGIVDVDGQINSGEALLVQGLLTGRGTFNPTYLTSVDGLIAPGSAVGVGTLTVQGDVILASGNELLIELGRNSGDQLRVTADAAQGTTGIASLGGDVWFTPALGAGSPRYGNVYTIVLADGGVQNTFDDVHAYLGVLRPELTYLPNSVQVKLKAGSFLDFITHNPLLMPFALALDELREDHYSALYNLYGEIDLMDPARLSAAFSSLAPGSVMDAYGLLEMQGTAFGDTLQQRMALLSSTDGGPLGLSVMGDPGRVLSFGGDDGLAAAGELSFASMMNNATHVSNLPGGLSAFFSGGYGESRASTGAGRSATTRDDGLRAWHMVGGVEQRFGAMTLGVAGGYSRGSAMQVTSSALAENDVAQTAMYGVYRFDGGAYMSGMVGYGSSRTSAERRFAAGSLDYQMHGDVGGELFLASIEGGMNFDLANGFTLTPNASLRQYSMRMDSLTETGGETALNIAEQRYEQLEARLGVRLSGEYAFSSGWVLTPMFDAAAVSSLSDDGGGVWASFAAAPDVPFYLPGVARDQFWGEVTGGLSLVRGDTSIGLRMESSIDRDDLYEDRYTARFSYRF